MSRPANIFELLQDENDSEVKKAPTTSKAPQSKAPTAQPAKTQQKAVDRSGEAKAARPKNDQPQQRRPQQQREGSGAPAQFEERRNRPPRQQGGEGRERREKQAERSENPKHRAFERRSGTGRGKEQKRGGAGKANWGTQEDDQKAQEATTEQVTEETTEQSAEAKVEATPEPVAEPNPEDEEDAKLKTLDDYRKTLKTPVVALPPPRVIEDKGEWSKYTALKRDEDEAPQKKATKKEDNAEKEEKDEKKIRADEVLKFTEGSPKDRRERGGFRRGGKDSPRGGRGGKRGGSTRSSAPNFSDERSFPSLSTATKA